VDWSGSSTAVAIADLPVGERAHLLALGQQTLEIVQHLKLQLEQAELERGSDVSERDPTARPRTGAAGTPRPSRPR